MRRELIDKVSAGVLNTASPMPIVEPEVARAQVVEALEAWTRTGRAHWLNAERTMIALADGSRWRLGETVLTRLE